VIRVKKILHEYKINDEGQYGKNKKNIPDLHKISMPEPLEKIDKTYKPDDGMYIV
jgi:hypothetical protein